MRRIGFLYRLPAPTSAPSGAQQGPSHRTYLMLGRENSAIGAISQPMPQLEIGLALFGGRKRTSRSRQSSFHCYLRRNALQSAKTTCYRIEIGSCSAVPRCSCYMIHANHSIQRAACPSIPGRMSTTRQRWRFATYSLMRASKGEPINLVLAFSLGLLVVRTDATCCTDRYVSGEGFPSWHCPMFLAKQSPHI